MRSMVLLASASQPRFSSPHREGLLTALTGSRRPYRRMSAHRSTKIIRATAIGRQGLPPSWARKGDTGLKAALRFHDSVAPEPANPTGIDSVPTTSWADAGPMHAIAQFARTGDLNTAGTHSGVPRRLQAICQSGPTRSSNFRFS